MCLDLGLLEEADLLFIPALGSNRSCQLHSGPGGVGAVGTVRFTYTQKVPSEAASHDTAHGHLLPFVSSFSAVAKLVWWGRRE